MLEIISIIFTIYVIHTFAWFTPGPLFILVLQNSLSHWFRAGCFNWIWIAIWNLIHMGYAVIGLLLIKGLSENILFYIKYIWAMYLCYLWVKILSSAKQSRRKKTQKVDENISSLSLIMQGFLVNITSPKASIFFVTIFTILVSKIENIYIILFAILLLSCNSLIMASVLSFLFSRKKVIEFYDKNLSIVSAILGTSMLIFAGLVLIY